MEALFEFLFKYRPVVFEKGRLAFAAGLGTYTVVATGTSVNGNTKRGTTLVTVAERGIINANLGSFDRNATAWAVIDVTRAARLAKAGTIE